MSKLDFNRNRIPMGAAKVLVELEAQCDAGGVNAAWLYCSV